MRTPFHALLLLALLLAACGDDTTEVSAGSPGPGTSAVPDVQLRIESAGGFVPVEVSLATFPSLVVADRTAWVPGAQILIYPAPAVPAVQSAPLDDDDLRALAQRLDEAADLFQGTDFGEPPVSDLPTTTVDAVVDGRDLSLAVYALDDEIADEVLTPEQRQARQDVRTLIADLRAVVETADRPWEVATTPELRVSSIPLDPNAPAPEDGLEKRPPVPWPAGVTEPAPSGDTAFGCVALSGAERDVLLEATAQTNVATPWQLSTGVHTIVLRPVFPGEPGCP